MDWCVFANGLHWYNQTVRGLYELYVAFLKFVVNKMSSKGFMLSYIPQALAVFTGERVELFNILEFDLD